MKEKIEYGITFLKAECSCQLVVKLNANKCFQKLLCYLSFYINFLNIKFFFLVPGPCLVLDLKNILDFKL